MINEAALVSASRASGVPAELLRQAIEAYMTNMARQTTADWLIGALNCYAVPRVEPVMHVVRTRRGVQQTISLNETCAAAVTRIRQLEIERVHR